MGVSLTAGMRSNLNNLQNTAKLMEQTSIRLNSGKKVNSALDDPISYFTAKSHMSRATDLGTLKNGMSEGIQTITAATNSIDSIISMIQAAKSKAESAKSASTETKPKYTMSELKLTDVVADDVVTIGGVGFIAGTSNTGTTFKVGATDEITAMNLANAVASSSSANNTGGIEVASINGSTITFENSVADVTSANIQFTDSEAFTSKILTPEAEQSQRDALVSQYETLMSQIEQMRNDSGYKGINLLDSASLLSVKFEGSNKLDITGFDGSLKGLGMNATAGNGAGWGNIDNIDADIAKLDAAMKTLESKASSLASSLSIVTTRQNFTTNMINTLTTGADNLTLADMNEEGANMLMLQTQQTLGTTSLSLAAQTAQGVLRLF